jgi:lysophospholipase L1-like esterase
MERIATYVAMRQRDRAASHGSMSFPKPNSALVKLDAHKNAALTLCNRRIDKPESTPAPFSCDMNILSERTMQNRATTRHIDGFTKTLGVTAIAMIMLVHRWASPMENQSTETLEQFQQFLEQVLHKHSTEQNDVETFHDRAARFWSSHIKDYVADPRRYQSLLTIYHKAQDLYGPGISALNLDRYETDITAFRRWDSKNTTPPNAVLFVGSSSIVLWPTSDAFVAYPVINRGFGGSTLLEVNHFYDDLIRKYAPAVVVIYCDNDVYLGQDPDVVLKDLKALTSRIGRDLPRTRIMFLAIKPTPADDLYGKDVRRNAEFANKLIKDFASSQPNMRFVDVATPMFRDGRLRSDLFLPDGIHLNARGYQVWNSVVTKPLSDLYAEFTADIRESAPYPAERLPGQSAAIAADRSGR